MNMDDNVITIAPLTNFTEKEHPSSNGIDNQDSSQVWTEETEDTDSGGEGGHDNSSRVKKKKKIRNRLATGRNHLEANSSDSQVELIGRTKNDLKAHENTEIYHSKTKGYSENKHNNPKSNDAPTLIDSENDSQEPNELSPSEKSKDKLTVNEDGLENEKIPKDEAVENNEVQYNEPNADNGEPEDGEAFVANDEQEDAKALENKELSGKILPEKPLGDSENDKVVELPEEKRLLEDEKSNEQDENKNSNDKDISKNEKVNNHSEQDTKTDTGKKTKLDIKIENDEMQIDDCKMESHSPSETKENKSDEVEIVHLNKKAEDGKNEILVTNVQILKENNVDSVKDALGGDGESSVTPSNKGKLKRSSSFDLQTESPNNLSLKGKKRKIFRSPPAVAKLALWKKPFSLGWHREVVYRQCYTEIVTTNAKRPADTYYYSPEGIKLRSMPEIENYLKTHTIPDLDVTCFTFLKEPVSEEPFEIVRTARKNTGRSPKSESTFPKLSTPDSSGSPSSVIPKVRKKPKKIAVPKKKIALPSPASSGQTYPSTPLSEETTLTTPPPKKIKVKKIKITPTAEKKVSALSEILSPESELVDEKPLPFLETKEEVLCSLNCLGRNGRPPTLHCGVCLCLFHPECVNFIGSSQPALFICLKCQHEIKAGRRKLRKNNISLAAKDNVATQPNLTMQSSQWSIKDMNQKDISQNSSNIPKYMIMPKAGPSNKIELNSGQALPPLPSLKMAPTNIRNSMSSNLISPPHLTGMPGTPQIIKVTSSMQSPPNLIPKPGSTNQNSILPMSQNMTRPGTQLQNSLPLSNILSQPGTKVTILKAKPGQNTMVSLPNNQNIRLMIPAQSLLKATNAATMPGAANKIESSGINQSSQPRFLVVNQQGQTAGVIYNVVSNNLQSGSNVQQQLMNIPNHTSLVSANKTVVTTPSITSVTSGAGITSLNPLISSALTNIPNSSKSIHNIVTTSASGGISRTMTTSTQAINTLAQNMGLTHTTPTNQSTTHSNIFPGTQNVSNTPVAQISVGGRTVTVLSANGQNPPDMQAILNAIQNTLKTQQSPSSTVSSTVPVSVLKAAEKDDLQILDPQSRRRSVRIAVSRKLHLPNPGACFIGSLHGGLDCLLHIFKKLDTCDLLRCMQVCHMWNYILSRPCKWKTINLRSSRVSDWSSAASFFNKFKSDRLDMRGMLYFEDRNRTWHGFASILSQLHTIKYIDFGHAPASIMHTVTDTLVQLEVLTAEWITDYHTDSQVQNSNARVDIGKFGQMVNLRELRLRGVCGLALPTFSFSGGLSSLETLKNLKKLALTSLKDIPHQEFSFLSHLTQLETLEIGDCTTWTEETYKLLSSQVNLRRLRLEKSGQSPVNALSEVLSHLTRLNHLELVMFNINANIGDTLYQLKGLDTISVLPDAENNGAEVNAETFNAIRNLTHLKKIDWGIIYDNSAGNFSDAKSKEIVPFLITNQNDYFDDTPKEIVMLSVSHLMDKLCKSLPQAKIRVFQLPRVAALRFCHSLS